MVCRGTAFFWEREIFPRGGYKFPTSAGAIFGDVLNTTMFSRYYQPPPVGAARVIKKEKRARGKKETPPERGKKKKKGTQIPGVNPTVNESPPESFPRVGGKIPKRTFKPTEMGIRPPKFALVKKRN